MAQKVEVQKAKVLQIYGVYDKVSKEFAYPTCIINEDSALRSLRLEMQKENCPFRHCPDDFQLFHLGVYDVNSGIITTPSMPRLVIELSKLIDAKPSVEKA